MNTQRIKQGGFTLMELLIVIAILGVLVAVGLSSFMSSQRKSRDAKRKNDLRQMSLALETYYNDFGAYPLSDGNHIMMGCGDGGISACGWGDVWSNSAANRQTVYMPELPRDPISTYTYYYDSADGKSYKLYARLENTQDGGFGVDPDGYDGIFCDGENECTYGVSSSGTSLAN